MYVEAKALNIKIMLFQERSIIVFRNCLQLQCSKGPLLPRTWAEMSCVVIVVTRVSHCHDMAPATATMVTITQEIDGDSIADLSPHICHLRSKKPSQGAGAVIQLLANCDDCQSKNSSSEQLAVAGSEEKIWATSLWPPECVMARLDWAAPGP